MPLEYYYVLSPKLCIIFLGMNTRIAAARRDEEEMANVRDNDCNIPENHLSNEVPSMPLG